MAVALSQIIEDYLRHQADATPFTDELALRRQILADTNVALARAESDRFTYAEASDPRLDSVVAVYRGDGGMGSGFYVTSDVVLTNWHVVKDFRFVEMKRFDEIETFGRVMAKDVRLDLALVEVQDRGKPVRFYGKNRIDLGATVEALGHPHRRLFSVTRGVVSTVREEYSINLPERSGKKVLYIQTDASINPGNSGGPLFLGDEVVGVNTWGISADVSQGLSFSVHYSEVLGFLRRNLPGFVARAN